MNPLAVRVNVEALVDALATERRLLDELVAILRRQRAAVGAEDLQGVDDSVFATHRVLLTLGEARRRRQSLHALLGGYEEDLPFDADGTQGPGEGTAVREARACLHEAALLLSGEVELNRRVLRQALATGEGPIPGPEPAIPGR